jgi:hypothetical protein
MPTLENNIKKVLKIYGRRFWTYLSGLRLNTFIAIIIASKLTLKNNIKKIIKDIWCENVDCRFLA